MPLSLYSRSKRQPKEVLLSLYDRRSNSGRLSDCLTDRQPVTKTENEAKASGFQFGASFQTLSLCQGALLE